jgi:hypothetical protein
MWYVYVLELALGLVFAADVALFMHITFRIKNQNLRGLWIITFMGHILAAFYVALWIARKFNIDYVQDERAKAIIAASLLIPGGITEIWCMVRHWRQRKKEDPSYNIWTGRSEKKE